METPTADGPAGRPHHRHSATPPEPLPPSPSPAPKLLNTDLFRWDDFETFTVDLALEVDGAARADLYGKPGQSQDGIDAHGFFDDGSVTAYQCKRVKRVNGFTVSDLDSAVNDFVTGANPNEAGRLVIATTTSTRGTKVTNRLKELQRLHAPLKIELWGQEHLSRELRPLPDLVRRYFGQATADLFCDPASAEPGPARTGFDADAILRGPIESLGLAGDFEAATAALRDNPARAAVGFRAIAHRLQASPYAPHASQLRRREADACRASEDALGVITAELEILRTALSAEDPGEANAVTHRLSQDKLEFPDAPVRSVNVFAAIAAFEHNRGVTLDEATKQFDETQDGDPYRLEAAVHLAEHAISNRSGEIVAARAAPFGTLVDSAGADDANRLLAARLAASVADATDDWSKLAKAARRYPPRCRALLLARFGRHQVRRQDPEAAIALYYDAIETACQAEIYADAADWALTIRLIRLRHGMLDDETHDLFRHASALRAYGSDSVIPAPFSPRERVLSRLHDGKLPDALEAIRMYLRRAVTLGDWSDEREAQEHLGKLLVETGDPMRAMDYLISAGAREDIEKLAADLQDGPLEFPLPDDLTTWPTWERACAFTLVAGIGDLLSDADARSWAGAALVEIRAALPAPLGMPNPYECAFKAFAAVAAGSSEEQAASFLALTEPLIEREPNRYRFSDKSHARGVIGVAMGHPSLRREAVRHMCKALIADQQLGDIVLTEGHEALLTEPDVVAEMCTPSAGVADDNRPALALVLTESDLAPVVDLARERVTALIQPRQHTKGTIPYYGGWTDIALLSLALPVEERDVFADAMLTVALDQDDAAGNRRLALETIATLGPHLSDEKRDELFDVAVEAAQGEHDGSSDDQHFSNHPLERFRVDMGAHTLRWSALRAIAALAREERQYSTVLGLAVKGLETRDDKVAHAVAQALTRLPAYAVALDPSTLALGGDDSLRALAAVLWCALDHPSDLGSRLARDPSPLVRRTLALNLTDGREHEAVRSLLAQDSRRSIRLRAARS